MGRLTAPSASFWVLSKTNLISLRLIPITPFPGLILGGILGVRWSQGSTNIRQVIDELEPQRREELVRTVGEACDQLGLKDGAALLRVMRGEGDVRAKEALEVKILSCLGATPTTPSSQLYGI